MNISVKSEYALKAILDLSTSPGPDPVKIADIAKRQNIPQKFLELILASLRQGGFVESRRGADGGYRLSRPANEITVGQVLAYVENGKKTARGAPDAFSEMWKRVDKAVSDIMDHTTFAELERQWREAQTRYVPSWDI
jgi:Rrf2 family transcriptional regulator, cysteine metabolism repressor